MDNFETGPQINTSVAQNSEKENLDLSRNRLVAINQLFVGMDAEAIYELQEKIYDNYANAMTMRDREPLEPKRFKHHFFEEGNFQKSKAFGGPKDGYLLGSEINGVFVPTHFSPSGLRQGYRLIKDLVNAEMPTALFITPDLVDTVRKMDGWKVLPFHFTTDFRGSDVEKTLVVNKWSAIPRLVTHQAKEIVSGRIKEISYKTEGLRTNIQELGQKAIRLIRKDKANADDIHDELQKSIEGEKNYLGASTRIKLGNPDFLDEDDEYEL